MYRKHPLLSLLFCLSLSLLHAQSKIDPSLLIGKWRFIKFDWPNYVPDTASIIKRSNNQFKDVIFEFTKDKHFNMLNIKAAKGSYTNFTYTVKDDKISVKPVAVPKGKPDIMEIDFLNYVYLKIYIQGFEPVATFRRL